MKLKTIPLILFVLVLAACKPEPQYEPTPTPTPLQSAEPTATTIIEGVETIPTPDVTPTPEIIIEPSGPDTYPEGYNPLTGLPVADPAQLQNPPLLVKVSNSPEVVRPQSGLMFADHVWEHQVEGYALTRLLVVLLGNTASAVGPVRSGRPPDLEFVPMYEGIYTASGYSSNKNDPEGPERMRQLMLKAPWRPRNFSAEFGYGDPYNVRIPLEGVAYEHTLFAIPDEMWALAAEKEIGPSTTIAPGLAFDPAPPAGGTPTTEFSIDYPGRGPLDIWKYDADKGRWLRWTDGEIHSERITEEQLNFDNVVVIRAQHYNTEWLEDEVAQLYGVGIVLTGEGTGTLLRDGMRYEVTWRRPASNHFIQFFDAEGNPIPFKPGNTWFHTASMGADHPVETYN